MGQILFEHLKLVDKPKKTKTGQYSTSEETLLKLKGKHKIIDDILEFRQLQKLKSTYVDALPDLATTENRIHTTYQQTVAATGRLSSINPNLQKTYPLEATKVEKSAKHLLQETMTSHYLQLITHK